MKKKHSFKILGKPLLEVPAQLKEIILSKIIAITAKN
ncbi:hypothetical protein KAOT1_15418 [Kordia algicida OT-1]|uniref:Uncharacterized protein n=1 Tax=Kordia algicida OT-1 TaxID=391587 RepID=A9DQ39_9FLAO|nr:hypothetical protein KAOT1_15418 [Kordia algicida OT-1]